MPRSNVFERLLTARLSRRGALTAMTALTGSALLTRAGRATPPRRAGAPSSLAFGEIAHGSDDKVHVPEGYRVQTLLAWGDPLFPDSPPFTPPRLTASAQDQQFGANADWISWMPLGQRGREASGRGLLCVNHEFANTHMMVPGFTYPAALERATREHCELEMAAIGMSIVEIARRDGRWQLVLDSTYNRRVSALSTRIGFGGPAAGHERLRSKGDPSGRHVRTFNNCGGGVTPWGTVLTCEENFNWHFDGRSDDPREAENHARYQVAEETGYAWARHFERFDAAKEPREPNRYGWVIELDPYDPTSVPVKRTALGRFKHESASCAVSAEGRVAVYSGDDDEFEHLYRFVTRRTWDPSDREANRSLLDDGELQAARFEEDGTLTWIPLVHGRGPLTKENGFRDQGDVVIAARHAARLCGATRMDRPEDIEVHPDGRVYVMLTNNRKRTEPEAASPRAANRHGHVVELVPPEAREDDAGRPDHTAREYRWNVLVMGGDPRSDELVAAYTHPETSEYGWFSCPDNAAIDPSGRLWISTDGASRAAGFADGVWACDLDGDGRALTRRFFRGPRGCEVCGPCFTPEGTTLFLAVQHPGVADDRGRSIGSYDEPTARYPDYDDERPARSTVIAVVRDDGGVIGT